MWTILISVGLVITFLAFAQNLHRQKVTQEAGAKKRQKSQETLQRLIREPRSVPEPTKMEVMIPVEEGLDEICQDFHEQVLLLSWGEMASKRLPMPTPGACDEEPDSLAAMRVAYVDKCLPALSHDVDINANGCFTALVQYRAFLTAERYHEQDLNQISQPQVLVDILMASLLSGDFSRMSLSAERLSSLEPDLYPAAKAKLIAGIASGLQAAEAGQTNHFESLDRDLQALEEFQADDPQLSEMALLVRTRMLRDLDRAQNILEEMQSAGAPPSLVLYWKGIVEWKRGNLEQAREILKTSAQTPDNQRDPRLQQALKEVMKASPQTEAAFNFRLDVNFDLDDGQ